MAAAKTKKCYYDVLGVEWDSTDDEIKKAFRKLALQLHPDKNPDRQDEAKEQFQTLQQAYETLSNPQDRGWYDKHRDALLSEFLENQTEGRKKEGLLVNFKPLSFASHACYSKFHDGETGFYTVYRQIFDALSFDERDSGFKEAIPSFGCSKSSYDDVVGPFYLFWDAYCTCKSFMWKDVYDSRPLGKRIDARIIAKENKRVRSESKDAWNKQVRALVGFVKFNDRRVKIWNAKKEAAWKQLPHAFVCSYCELGFLTSQGLARHEMTAKHLLKVEKLREGSKDQKTGKDEGPKSAVDEDSKHQNRASKVGETEVKDSSSYTVL